LQLAHNDKADKSLAVALTGDHLATTDMVKKWGGAAVPLLDGGGS